MAEISNHRRRLVFKRDNFTCQYCGIKGKRTDYINHKGQFITGGMIDKFNDPIKDSLEIDHIIPKSKGGSNQISNLITACWECNHKKGNEILDE